MADGSVDPTFAPRPDATVRAVAVRPGATRAQDSVLVGGDFGSVATTSGTERRPRA